MKICRIATVPFFLQNHLREQICATVRAGHDVTLVCGDGPEIAELLKIPGVRLERIDIPRTISPWRDLMALWKLRVFFARERFDIVHSTTPKAGMLSMLAGYMAGIPVRLHTFTGQPWVELRGMTRILAKTGDMLTNRFSTLCYADSPSQRDFLVAHKVAQHGRIRTIGSGSLGGVDLTRFAPDKWKAFGNRIRAELGIESDMKVITFIGRVTRDKGIPELVAAMGRLRSEGRRSMLLLVGPFEPERDPLPEETLQNIHDSNDIRCLGYTPEPEKILSVTDVLCLPSYREGFGNVVIEAAAMGVPAVGSDIIGLRDAIVNRSTGILVPPKDADALAAALGLLLDDPALRDELGRHARERVLREFDSTSVNANMLAEYERLTRATPGTRLYRPN